MTVRDQEKEQEKQRLRRKELKKRKEQQLLREPPTSAQPEARASSAADWNAPRSPRSPRPISLAWGVPGTTFPRPGSGWPIPVRRPPP